jgi:hypothetical protein
MNSVELFIFQSEVKYYQEKNPTTITSTTIKSRTKPVLVAHACNSSYSGGRDQEITV